MNGLMELLGALGLVVFIIVPVGIAKLSWDDHRRLYCDCGQPLAWGAKGSRKTNKRTGEIRISYRNQKVCERGFDLPIYQASDHFGWDYDSADVVRLGALGTKPSKKPDEVKVASRDS